MADHTVRWLYAIVCEQWTWSVITNIARESEVAMRGVDGDPDDTLFFCCDEVERECMSRYTVSLIVCLLAVHSNGDVFQYSGIQALIHQ